MTKKMTQYFPHDYNARNDPKIQELLAEIGMEGLGIYWCIVEMLYEQGGKLPIKSYKSIAFALHANCTCIADVIENFGLFEKDDKEFWSNSVLTRLGKRQEVAEQKRRAAEVRWGVKNSNADALKNNADAMQVQCNKIKEKENKKENKVCESVSKTHTHLFDLIVSLFNRDFSKPFNSNNNADIRAVEEIVKMCGSEENVRLLFDYVAKNEKRLYSFHLGAFKNVASEMMDKAHEWQAKEEQREYRMKEDAMRIAERQREAQMEAEREKAEEMQKKARQLRALEIGEVLEKSVSGYKDIHFPIRRSVELSLAELLPTEKSEKKITQMYYSLIKTK